MSCHYPFLLYWSIWIARNHLILEFNAPDWDVIFDFIFLLFNFLIKIFSVKFQSHKLQSFKKSLVQVSWTITSLLSRFLAFLFLILFFFFQLPFTYRTALYIILSVTEKKERKKERLKHWISKPDVLSMLCCARLAATKLPCPSTWLKSCPFQPLCHHGD
jgi:hypothetical protein